jgi:hypothetical protein
LQLCHGIAALVGGRTGIKSNGSGMVCHAPRVASRQKNNGYCCSFLVICVIIEALSTNGQSP